MTFRRHRLLLLAFTAAIAALAASSLRAAEPLEAEAVVRANEGGGTISRHLYGHFAEHLGR